MKSIFVIFCVAFIITNVFISKAQSLEEYLLVESKDYDSAIPARKIKQIKLPKGYHEGLCVRKGAIAVNNGENNNTWLIDIKSGEMVSDIKPIGTFSEGISHAGNNKYWFTDWDTKKLYLVRIKESSMTSDFEISFEPSHPTGVVWDGKHIYVMTWTMGIETKYHLIKLDSKGNVLQRFKIETIPEPSQITWDGKNLWISSWSEKRVYRVDTKKMEITGSFKSEIEKTTGIVWDKGRFWITGTSEDLYLIELNERKE